MYTTSMQKRNIITICGNLGSGKSTTAQEVARILGYDRYSGGDFMRHMALERGMTLMELTKAANTDISIDTEIDKRQKEFMNSHDNFVSDSRLGWYFTPDSFKVFLKLDPRIAAERVFADKREGEFETEPQSVLDIEESLRERFESETGRYREQYGIENYSDPNSFDLVIDTEKYGVEEVVNQILDGYKAWQSTK